MKTSRVQGLMNLVVVQTYKSLGSGLARRIDWPVWDVLDYKLVSQLCSNGRILCGVRNTMYGILCTVFPIHLVMNEMRKQVREDHERWRKSIILCRSI